jgi:hypothetical protein
MVERVIDARGVVWDAHSRDLQRHLGYPAPDFDLVGYAIRNLDFIALRWRGGTARLRLAPRPVSHDAFAAAVRLLVDAPAERYLFEIGADASYIELVANLNDAIARLEDFVEDIATRGGSIVVDEPLSLDRLRHPKRRQLRLLLREWRRREGKLPRKDMLGPFDAAGLRGRSIMTRVTSSCAQIEFFGPRLDVYDETWSDRAIGRNLADQPDPAYGENTARGYREVGAAGEPRLELVDALIRAPDRAPQRSRYERLLLPWTTADGTMFVSGSSLLRTRFSAGIAR